MRRKQPKQSSITTIATGICLTPYASRLTKFFPVIALLFALSAVPATARADTYRVDLIVFLDKSDPAEQGRTLAQADNGKTLSLSNSGALKAAGIEILPSDQFALNDQWSRLKSSRRYQPMIRLAWLQKDPPADRSVALRLNSGESFASSNGDGRGATLQYPVDGSVALLLGNYLSLDADLVYTQKSAGGAGTSAWRLKEKRRMKRDQLHHLDSPKLGILVQVSKAQAP